MADGDVEVLVEDEQPKGDQATGTETVVETVKEPADQVTEDIEEVRRNLDAERARANAAEQRARDAERRAGQAETSAYGSQMALIDGALDTLKANRETLGTQYEEALAAGDFKRAREINGALIKIEVQENDLNKGKQALESQPRTQRAAMPANDTQKIEAYAQQLDARAAAWVKAHPEYVLDPQKNNQMLEQHHRALGKGLQQGSDAYYAAIEQGLGLSGEAAPVQRPASNGHAEPDPTAQAAKVVQRRDEVQPPPAGASRGGGPRRIQLTRAQQEAADISGLSYEEYARSLDRERKAGTLIFTEGMRKH